MGFWKRLRYLVRVEWITVTLAEADGRAEAEQAFEVLGQPERLWPSYLKLARQVRNERDDASRFYTVTLQGVAKAGKTAPNRAAGFTRVYRVVSVGRGRASEYAERLEPAGEWADLSVVEIEDAGEAAGELLGVVEASPPFWYLT